MKMLAGLLIVAASLLPYVLADSAAAAAASAASSNGASTAIAISVAITSSAHIPCKCTCGYDPVCGSDGRTYSNECSLGCVRNEEYPLTIVRRGECPPPVCVCPAVVDQVCGTDNQTYGNECLLKCENSRRRTTGIVAVTVKHHGPCKRPRCRCPNVVVPVCGSDGRTYRNVCVLQCQGYYERSFCRPWIGVRHKGVCKYENCGCDRRYYPVCANDGRTYNNPCQLHCENRKRNQLDIYPPIFVLQRGQCFKGCRCTQVYSPVCGRHKHHKQLTSFANVCTFNCENQRRRARRLPTLDFHSHGVCPCPCPLNYQPVCGGDETTYDNSCTLNCENKRRSDLGMRRIPANHNGHCRCSCDCCDYSFRPVCGSDSRSYWNKCWFNCNRVCNSRPGRPLWVVKYSAC